MADALLTTAILVGSIAYLVSLPWVLGGSDEGIYLYEAKRLLGGEVFYRDIFDLITPGSHYLMAGLFWLFGADMATARFADAAVHGLIGVTVYATCRRLGVRRALAAGAALCQLALFRPAWEQSSPHWVATLLGLVLLYVLVRTRGRGTMAAGVVAGLVLAVQQQKGAVLVTGAAAALVAGRLAAGPTGERGLARQLAGLAAGFLVVALPLVGLLAWPAGLVPVVRALVWHPLVNYHHHFRVPWGYVGFHRPACTFPALLAVLPGVTALAALRVVLDVHGRVPAERRWTSAVLTVIAIAWIGTIGYYPDYIHLAFIGPVFAILAVDLLEWALGRAARWPRLARLGGWAVATCLLAGAGFQLADVAATNRRTFSLAHETAFGTMNFGDQAQIDAVEEVRRTVHDAGYNELFVYPGGASWYLMTGTTNPTPYQILIPDYSGADQLADVIDILERRQVPFVLLAPIFAVKPGDPVGAYGSQHYTPVGHGAPLLRRIGR